MLADRWALEMELVDELRAFMVYCCGAGKQGRDSDEEVASG